MNFIIAFSIVMAFMLIGEWVSTVSHAYIPSVFVSAILFVIGFWTVLPKTVVASASFGPQFISIAIPLLLVHLGTLMSLKELLQQWKAVCIALLGVIGTLILTLTIGTWLFNWHTVVAAIPPLTGGLVSALLMSNGLKSQGITALVALPVSMFVLHSVVGYPLTAAMLKHEGKRLSIVFNKNRATLAPKYEQSDESKEKKDSLIKLPNAYVTSAYLLVKVAIVALISMGFAMLIHNVINANVVCLIFGVIAHQLGFLENNILGKAGVFSWLMYGLLAYVFGQLSSTTPSLMGTIIVQIITLIALGLLGMFLAARLLAKPFGMTWQMAYACSLTSLFGFPADYILTSEISRSVASGDKPLEGYLRDQMMPKMLVGGFATVSVASVIIASIFLKLL
ncbi:hypothetical protein [Furfurilactobacillus milii]|uniref:DUF819 family protein n=1 Tax=Furfurilactobacillus milii TaxID=2888272 RepID=A0A6N9I3D8_9LACO|nr:hypothetical protein [Furfurilactobacillus milii]MYV17224.1 hypothetical protein [Furfurilactobacillus milii]